LLGPGVSGVPFSGGLLPQAAARCVDVRWVQGDALPLPFPNATFDALTSTEAFHWFPDQVTALREFRRVLAPEGTLLVAVTAPPRPVGRAGEAVSKAAGQPARWQSRAELRHLVEAAGLRLVAQRRIMRLPGGLLLPPVVTVARRPATPTA